MQLSSFTHVGMVRHNNEDSCLVIPPWNSLAIERHACVFAVADGMGGQNAGEVASSIAMSTSCKWFAEHKAIDSDKALFEDMVGQVNAAVWNYAQNHPETAGMGNTFTFVLVKDNKAVVAHIGDSRLYRLRNNEMKQLTNDHSLVAEQVRLGKLTPQQARVHPTRNILSRVMGSRQFVTPDIFETELQLGDIFMICSDGVFGMIEDTEIQSIITGNSPERAARKLVEAANRAGGKDNATAVVFAVDQLPVSFPSLWSLSRIKNLLINNVNAGGI